MRGRTVLLALCALLLAAAATAQDQRSEPARFADEAEALRQKNAREEHKATQESMRRWTWAAMAPITYESDERSHRTDLHPARMARVTALAGDASGAAIVGGLVRGPIELDATKVAKTEHRRGFIARVDRRGGFRMIQLAQAWLWPSALAVDRAGNIIVSYEDRKLASMTPQGRTLWSRDLPPARALAVAPDGDLIAAGCKWGQDRTVDRLAKAWMYEMDLGDGYVARISPRGDVRWMYRMERAPGDLFYRKDDRPVSECAHAIAPGPGGDIYVAGTYNRDVPEDVRDPPNLPSRGRFLARFSADGRLRWSRVVAEAVGNVSLAATPDGSLVVVAGPVAPAEPNEYLLSEGLAAFDADGKPLWVVPVRKAPQAAGANPRIDSLQIVAHKTGNSDFVLAGTYEAAIVAGDASLEWTDGGVFLANIDRRGSVKSLRGLRAQREPARDGAFARDLRVGASLAGLWVGGVTGKDGRGAWVQAVPW